MKSYQRFFLTYLLLLIFGSAQAQTLVQTIRGTVTDKILQKPIPGATIRLLTVTMGDQTDEQGMFSIQGVPVGVHAIVVSALGYKEVTLNNLTLNSGKELVLQVTMEEKIIEGKEVVIKTAKKKNVPINDMSLISARSFSVEETQKYAAAVNDPSRMASNYPGVMMADDGNNQIVIRGNSPSGLLWRMEGVDIPNPNHFASAGSSGGGISIISSQLLSNSDFVTGAFSSEYGNALSGVFDLKLRKGNNKKREYSLQAGVLGLNAAAEGPFASNYKGSYLINYRYSTLSVLSKSGILDMGAVTNFQDLSYNIFLPTKSMGTFTLFSFGGLSDQNYDAKKDSSTWKNYGDRYSSKFISNTGLWGATHSIHLGSSNLLKTCIAFSKTRNAYHVDYTLNDYNNQRLYEQDFQTQKITLSSSLNHRVNSRWNVRTGVIGNAIWFDFFEKYRPKVDDAMKTSINTKAQTQSVQAFLQTQYRMNDKLTAQVGLHALSLLLNNSFSVEPRAALRYEMNEKQVFSLGYGLHSQLQGWGIYFANATDSFGQSTMPNRNLGFSKAHHIVFSQQYSFHKDLKLKTEFYYQHLFNIPVSTFDTNTLSAINLQNDYVRDPMVNKGKGRNYGLEISLEKYLSKQFYYMASASLYTAKYTASNGKEYNSKFNGGQIYNLIAGKEFSSKNQRRTFGLNVKMLYAGGYRTTPVNVDESLKQETTVYYMQQSFTEQLPAYYRGDIRISMKWNRKRFTSTLSLDLQNATNRKNVYDRMYDFSTKSVKYVYQTGIIPILNYKIEW